MMTSNTTAMIYMTLNTTVTGFTINSRPKQPKTDVSDDWRNLINIQ